MALGDLISLGLGSPASVQTFLLDGLSVNPTVITVTGYKASVRKAGEYPQVGGGPGGAVSFSYRAGESVHLLFSVVDEDGAAADITGVTVRFVVSRSISATPVADSGGSPATATAQTTTPAAGGYEALIEPDVTQEFAGTYHWESWIEDGQANRSESAYGYLTFNPSVRVVNARPLP